MYGSRTPYCFGQIGKEDPHGGREGTDFGQTSIFSLLPQTKVLVSSVSPRLKSASGQSVGLERMINRNRRPFFTRGQTLRRKFFHDKHPQEGVLQVPGTHNAPF